MTYCSIDIYIYICIYMTYCSVCIYIYIYNSMHNDNNNNNSIIIVHYMIMVYYITAKIIAAFRGPLFRGSPFIISLYVLCWPYLRKYFAK